jgi:hypothetical protein
LLGKRRVTFQRVASRSLAGEVVLRTESSRFKSEAAEELEIASLRSDGTLRNPRTIWVVRDGDDIYVRSVNGVTSDW